MQTATDIVRAFYACLGAGDAPGALALMASDIEWITMWHYKVEGRGPQRVAEGLLKPLMAEWSSFSMQPDTFIAEGERFVSLGHFKGRHGTSGKSVDAAYAHIWTICAGKLTSFRQYIDTRAVEMARV